MQELEPVFAKVARYFSLLSDASRLKVIHAVCNTEQSVTDVMTTTGLSQSAVSRHLTHLHLSGVASRRKAGAQALYVISDTTLTEICRTACVSLMARESDELTVASALQESAAQFMAQGAIDAPVKSVRPEHGAGFDVVESSDPSLRSGRTEPRISRVATVAGAAAVATRAAVASVAKAAQFMTQGAIDAPVKSVRPERSEGFDAVDSSNPSLRSGRTDPRVSSVTRPAGVPGASRVAGVASTAKAA